MQGLEKIWFKISQLIISSEQCVMFLFHLPIMSNIPIQIPINVDILKSQNGYQGLFPIDFVLRKTLNLQSL